ncbi:MAG: hypothetical protein ACTSXJ_07225 [Candidatus Baldrarchaeia archaeon]
MDCNRMLRELLIRRNITDLGLEESIVYANLTISRILSEEKLFRELERVMSQRQSAEEVLFILHFSTLIERLHKKLKEAEKIIKDFFNIIPLMVSDTRPIVLVEKMFEGFYPMQCITRRELEEVSDVKVKFLPYRILEVNGFRTDYDNAGETIALCRLEDN